MLSLGITVYVLLQIFLFVGPIVETRCLNWKNVPKPKPRVLSTKLSQIKLYFQVHLSILFLIRDYIHYIPVWDFLHALYGRGIAKRYDSYMPNLGHNAIVIVHSNFAGMSMYGSGIGLLISHFRKASPITPYVSITAPQ
ncbi:hypothetical protein MchiMG62_24540 [Methanoculleus chikugoensis]|uniref:Uncharacterized protein n=1 Tax=Methanoculleus chikugoensis TaxID=118126 RepID=A0ABM7H8Z5_9EURY|nr:hypothetical protein MchiMG62_24540 [Methanoculleus chikugoensis]